jgi:D-glycero-alpha-D-manno-heptose-7-phosphate kinase
MRIEASAPTRVDLAGGTVDIWPLYLFHANAQTLNAALSLRAHCHLTTRGDGRLSIASRDADLNADVGHWRDLPASSEFALLRQVTRQFDARGLHIETHSESPFGAGIAGSSALNVAMCASLARWAGLSVTPDALLGIAQNVEAQALGVPTGVQDYRPAFYGGVSAVELRVDGVKRLALPVDVEALDSRLIVAYTGASRNSGINNWDVFKRHIDGDGAVRARFAEICAIATSMREALEHGHWRDVARLVAEEWAVRKRLAPGVTTPEIDGLIEAALGAGALAAKVCGAGGGGCVMVLADPDRRAAVGAALIAHGVRVLDCHVEREGLRLSEEA